VRPEAAPGEPDDVGVDRDLDGRVAGVVVWPARGDGEHCAQMVAVGAADLGEGADVELPVVAAGGGASPEPVAAAEGLVGWQVAVDRLGNAVAGRAPAAGRAQHLVESLNVAQVIAVRALFFLEVNAV